MIEYTIGTKDVLFTTSALAKFIQNRNHDIPTSLEVQNLIKTECIYCIPVHAEKGFVQSQDLACRRARLGAELNSPMSLVLYLVLAYRFVHLRAL
jgi:hypothetical protein